VTYVSQPEATEAVRKEVNAIDGVLREVLSETDFTGVDQTETAPIKTSRKSA
jgi:hypothetical protein